MTRKSKWILIITILIAAGIGFWAAYKFNMIPFLEKSEKVESSHPELTKMAKIIDQYKTADLEVIVDGYHRKPGEFLTFARAYLGRHFDPQMNAETWVKTYAYRSRLGEIIYFKYPDGSSKPMRDVFLEELKKTEEKEKS